MDKLIFSGLTFVIYGSSCIISLIFIFSLETYKRIDEALCSNFFSLGGSNPLDINFRIDQYFMDNNKLVGTILFILSFVDIKLCLDFINML